MNEVKISKKRFLEIVEKYDATRPDRLVYYALIELPSGRHIPLPIVLDKRIVSLKDLEKIPLSKKKRDNRFYVRPCGAYSFFKCPYWSDESETKTKLLALKRLLREGQYKKLRIVLPAIYEDEHGTYWGAWELHWRDYACENCPLYSGWEYEEEWCKDCGVYKRMKSAEGKLVRRPV